jgi:hypothetical protein
MAESREKNKAWYCVRVGICVLLGGGAHGVCYFFFSILGFRAFPPQEPPREASKLFLFLFKHSRLQYVTPC